MRGAVKVPLGKTGGLSQCIMLRSHSPVYLREAHDLGIERGFLMGILVGADVGAFVSHTLCLSPQYTQTCTHTLCFAGARTSKMGLIQS